MKKVCENWNKIIPDDKVSEAFFADFETRAKNAGAEIFRIATAKEAKEILANLIKFTNAKKVVMAESKLQKIAGIDDTLHELGIQVYTDVGDIAEHAESADIGISTVEFAIGETGSLVMDGFAFESRLVSMLPPTHVAFLNSKLAVGGVTEAMEIISKTYDNGYISFITGPSRTSDIERVLTIGVHGPSRLIVIAVDEQIDGGDN